MALYKSTTPFFNTNVLWENYASMVEIYDEILKLPLDIQKALNSAHKESLKKAIFLQIEKFYYEGTAKKPTEILPFEELKVAKKQEEQGNFEQAREAYIDLYKRYQRL